MSKRTKKAEAKHTPGPWMVFDEIDRSCIRRPGVDAAGISIVCYGGGMLGDHAGVHGQTTAEAWANARLIAAAPELLEACKKATTCASIPDEVMQIIRAAIAKATK